MFQLHPVVGPLVTDPAPPGIGDGRNRLAGPDKTLGKPVISGSGTEEISNAPIGSRTKSARYRLCPTLRAGVNSRPARERYPAQRSSLAGTCSTACPIGQTVRLPKQDRIVTVSPKLGCASAILKPSLLVLSPRRFRFRFSARLHIRVKRS